MSSSTKKLMMMTLAAMAMAPGGLGALDYETQPEKECLQCKKPHSHNNSFCSAECCKLFRSNKK